MSPSPSDDPAAPRHQLPHGTSRTDAAVAFWLLIAIWLFVGLTHSHVSLTTLNSAASPHDLHEHIPPRAPPATTIVHLSRTYLAYPIYSDGAPFATQFGQILKFRDDIRVLATSTLRSLAAQYNYPGALADAVLPDFFGAHVRTERDAQLGWPGPDWVYSQYETQAALVLSAASNAGLLLIYVPSGDREGREVERRGGGNEYDGDDEI
ncbi:hypothetical protein GMDG_07042 [Pseudogymnoascus destructans 20631-21]|uniref:Uncharacterized protein n=1 Tax=Pseudogymnoascus destructans (strain ATCC MYA-4855 / 20631-21) TaxID=658429 RepID=L8FYM4_PSED2|nr:hypothetical protein GMDG_07042 [Pseudogymnoascus destructans 20631-21]